MAKQRCEPGPNALTPLPKVIIYKLAKLTEKKRPYSLNDLFFHL